MSDPSERNGQPREAPPSRPGRLLLVGARRQVRRLAGCLDQEPWSGVPVVGFVDVSGRGRQLVVHPKSHPVPILG
ncbi:MAG: sugar transferase, partial [Isosphaeraceae bacterium]|nr:sugar transferase [Isosphaeraceae bacterium]